MGYRGHLPNYRFGMDKEGTLSTTGEKMKPRTPYDFVAITNHTEYYDVFKDLIDPKTPPSKSAFAKQLAKAIILSPIKKPAYDHMFSLRMR